MALNSGILSSMWTFGLEISSFGYIDLNLNEFASKLKKKR